MFKELGQLAGLMRHLPRLKEEMERLQQKLGQLTAEGDAGGGMVRVKMNGRMEVVSCSLSDEVMNDRELLEDLIRAASNVALERIRKMLAEETGKMWADMGIPMGMNLPGMGT